MRELEKRWKISVLPNFSKLNVIGLFEITQFHIANFEKGHNRIRYTKDLLAEEEFYEHTTKYAASVPSNEREELTMRISKKTFEKLVNIFQYVPIKKKRYVVELGNGLLGEIDWFEDGTKIVEVEFPNYEAIHEFVPNVPEWFGEEMAPNYNVLLFNKLNNIKE